MKVTERLFLRPQVDMRTIWGQFYASRRAMRPHVMPIDDLRNEPVLQEMQRGLALICAYW